MSHRYAPASRRLPPTASAYCRDACCTTGERALHAVAAYRRGAFVHASDGLSWPRIAPSAPRARVLAWRPRRRCSSACSVLADRSVLSATRVDSRRSCAGGSQIGREASEGAPQALKRAQNRAISSRASTRFIAPLRSAPPSACPGAHPCTSSAFRRIGRLPRRARVCTARARAARPSVSDDDYLLELPARPRRR